MDLLRILAGELGERFEAVRESVTQAFFYEPAAADRLAEELRRHCAGNRVVVWSDVRTRAAAGEACLGALARAGWSAVERVIPDRAGGGGPVCDDVTQAELARHAPAADAYVAVGSGVVNDLTKWLAVGARLPYAVLGTAASMNGYAAANVAPTIDGVKSLLRAAAPRVIAAIPQVVESAPARLAEAGLGDVIAKPVSTADWRLNSLLFDEPFAPDVADLIRHVEPRYLDRPGALRDRAPDAIEALFEALVLSGCAMTLVGSSLPASGGEHLISHTLDMWSLLDGQPHDLHGRQVGVATLFVAELYQRMLRLPQPTWRPASVPFDRDRWGRIAAAVEPEHRAKAHRMAQACCTLAEPGRWRAIQAEIASIVREPSSIQHCLRAAGAAHRLADIGCSRERFLAAVHHAGAMRRRFTSIDLAHAAGLLPDAAEEIVDEWLV